MKHCAFLTMDNLADFECYDHLLYEPFTAIGWQATPVAWRDSSVNWNTFEAVVIRSPWDYQQEPDRFMSVLKKIDSSSARLENSLNLVQWNIDKTYLKELQQKGVAIVSTLWDDGLEIEKIPSFFETLGTDELIIKPVISANADNTFRLQQPLDAKLKTQLKSIFRDRPCMMQPFMKKIVSEGEFSLFYFAGRYSHTILKTPKSGDFRVQEEHGGQLQLVEPEPELRTDGKQAINALPEIPLYARVDFVRTSVGAFALMEVELIEPSLYFNMDPNSAERFAKHFEEWMKKYI